VYRAPSAQGVVDHAANGVLADLAALQGPGLEQDPDELGAARVAQVCRVVPEARVHRPPAETEPRVQPPAKRASGADAELRDLAAPTSEAGWELVARVADRRHAREPAEVRLLNLSRDP
jgi:hypothetical protein